jgi:type I restriction enzyme S subunit
LVADVRFSSVDKLIFPSEECVRLCNYIDVYKNDYITGDLEFMSGSATWAEIERFGLQVGDVIITKDSETPDDIGIPAIVDYASADLVCGYHLGLLRTDQTRFDPTFLAKQLGHHRLSRYFGRQANGLTRYGLPLASVRNAPVWLPKIEQQTAIGRIARLMDSSIARTEAVIAKLRQVRTGVLHGLLTRGVDDHGLLRPSPIEAAHLYRDSPLGKIPCEWGCPSLEEAMDWFSGGTPDRSRRSLWNGPIPLLTPKDMKVLELSDTSEHITTDAILAGSRLMPEQTVFIVVRGMILAHTFPVCLCSRPFAFNQDIKAVRGRGKLGNRFLAQWFVSNSSEFLRKVSEATHGTKKLDMSELHRVYIGVPSPDEQQAILERLDALDEYIAVEMSELNKLVGLKTGLMADLLTGRVPVPEALEFQGACP